MQFRASIFLLLFLHISSILCFFQAGYVIRDLEGLTQAEFHQETLEWQNGGGVPADDFDCNYIYLLGDTMANGPYQKTFQNLPTHQSVVLSAEIYVIDAEDNAAPSVELKNGDGTQVFQGGITLNTASTVTTDYCGSNAVNDLGPVYFFQAIPHTDSTLQVVLQKGANIQGFRNLKIFIMANDISTAATELGCGIIDPLADMDVYCGCPVSQFYDGSSCQPCDDACENCYGSGSNSCYTCKDGYHFDGTNCLPCDNACSTCYGAGINSCLSCGIRHYFDGVSSCLECHSSCLLCFGAGPSACIECINGDTPNAKSQCGYVAPSESSATVTASTKTIMDVKATTQIVVGAALIANTLVNTGSSGAIRFSMLAKMIQYVKYLDIDYPTDVKYAISNSKEDDFINFNSDNLDLTPNSFEHYGSSYGPLPTSIGMYDERIQLSFLMNIWAKLIPLFILSGLVCFVIVFEVIASKTVQGENPKKIIHQLGICVQGLLITYLYNDFPDIFFFAILNYRTTKESTTLTVANIIVSVLFIILTIGALVAQTMLVKKYQTLKTKDQDEFEKLQAKVEGAKVLWKDFKDDSFVQMNALVFLVLHDIVFCLALATMSDHPLAQVILINILSLAIITYLLWFRPFDKKLQLIQMIICEVTLFAVNICLLILASLDSNSNSRESTGKAILLLTMMFNFVPLGFLTVTAIFIAKKIYHAIKTYQSKKKLDQLKKPPGVHIKKSQVSPTTIESPKDKTTLSSKFTGNASITQINSHALGKKDSIGSNLLFAETLSQGHHILSPPSKLSIQVDRRSDHDDQLLNAEDNDDARSRVSRLSPMVTHQQKRTRKNQKYFLQKEFKDENLESDTLFKET